MDRRRRQMCVGKTFCDYLQRDFVNKQVGGGGTDLGRLPAFHGASYQLGYGGIGTIFGRIARMAMPIVRLMLPHVVSGIGELATTIASTIGNTKRQKRVKKVLRKHGLRVADDVIKTLKTRYENYDDDDKSDTTQVGGGVKKKKSSGVSKVFKRHKSKHNTHSRKRSRRRRTPSSSTIQERDIFG